MKEQIAFADVILLNNVDLVSPQELEQLERRIQSMNAAAKVYRTKIAAIDMDAVLHVVGFNLDRSMEVDPKFMEPEYPLNGAVSMSLSLASTALLSSLALTPR